MDIELNIDGMILSGRLFDGVVTERLFNALPLETALQTWGDECYGPIGVDLGEENPVPVIPEGGIAYTNQGNYLCIFYGQRPAWPVEHVGEIRNGDWKKLRGLSPKRLQISAVQ